MKIAYDTKLMRPACVLLSAVCGVDSEAAYWFDSKHWLLAPTPDLKVYEVTEAELRTLVILTEGHAKKRERTP